MLDEIRESSGRGAQKALFSVPAPGRLLVASDSGVWVVQQDGSRRLLGDYREATWSPFGRFVAAVGENELVALEADGEVRWTLARPRVRFPRWTGTLTDTRIAYLSGREPRLVAGDGTGDRPLCVRVSARRRPSGVLTKASCRARRPERSDRALPRRRLRPRMALGSGSRGTQGRVVRRRDAAARGRTGRRAGAARRDRAVVRVERASTASFRPGTHELALLRQRGEVSELVVGERVLFRGTGEFRDLAWSPDGRWVLVAWPMADQWVFVRADGPPHRAVSNVVRAVRRREPPRIEGWCCAR